MFAKRTVRTRTSEEGWTGREHLQGSKSTESFKMSALLRGPSTVQAGGMIGAHGKLPIGSCISPRPFSPHTRGAIRR